MQRIKVSEYLTTIKSNYNKIFNKIKDWSEDDIKIFMQDFHTEISLKKLNLEDDLIDVWKKWNKIN